MKYRRRSKIKKQHHLIDELEPFLKKIEDWPEIDAINPGVIKNCGHDDKLKFTVSYVAENGLKCLARSHGAVQEVFIVSSHPQIVAQKLASIDQ